MLRRTYVRCFELCDIYPLFKAHRIRIPTRFDAENEQTIFLKGPLDDNLIRNLEKLYVLCFNRNPDLLH